ncbi:MAG TPA: Mur ligase family protein [Candidatus Paceibacterota bacterium]|nr:Mur ligase family protein [Candidatus Paceibacterota bacterium]
MTASEFFKGKKVTLMGLGLLGRGIGDAEFLARAGADLIVTDLKSETDLAPALERLKGFGTIVFHLGGHRLEDFENRDFIVRAPNAPIDSPFLAHARERGVPIGMDASLFARFTAASIVGVTGTRGKSTVTHLVHAMLRAGGRSAHLGGNVRDMATLPLADTLSASDIAVLELDSWQLQGFEEASISPRIAVWTTFMPDHMNYYHGDVERYFRDKAAIARFQKPGDTFITSRHIKEEVEAKFGPLLGSSITDPAIPDDWPIGLEGAHNRMNTAFAAAAARSLGVCEKIIKETLQNFKALPGRLELLGEKDGILFYNDSNSTTPEACIAALEALAPKRRPIILIGGGSDKQLDFTALAPRIEHEVQHLILFKGSATDKLLPLLPKTLAPEIVSSMDDAFKKACAAAKPGDIVLLSPAATSFGIFRNEYDRGDQFRRLFTAL